MLQWTLIFFVVAIVAAVFGFGGIAAASAGIAKLLFFILIISNRCIFCKAKNVILNKKTIF